MTERSSTLVDIAPAGSTNLPSVTMPMLDDFLADETVMYRPSAPRRVFRWLSALDYDGIAYNNPTFLSSAHLLHLVHADEAESFLLQGRASFALVVAPPNYNVENLVQQCGQRIMVIQQSDTFERIVTKVHAYFVKLLLWEASLSCIAANGGTLTEMLDASVSVLKNFIFISDNDFNVIAYTTHVPPPDDLHRTIVEGGCLTPRTIREKRYRLPERVYYTKEPSSITPFARLSRPLYLNHAYFCSVSMSCNVLPLTEGLKDLFALFIKHVILVCQHMWHSQIELAIPHYFFFEKLLNHELVGDEYVHAQLEMINLPEESDFKVVVFEVDNSTEPAKARQVMQNAATLNRGRVFCFPFQKVVVALLHTPPSDCDLSHRITIREVRSRICEAYDVSCGLSEVFTGIENLDLAYRSAIIALSFKHAVRRERFVSPEEAKVDVSDKMVYLFGDVLSYYLIASSDKDDRFRKFCFQHTIMHKLYEEDRQNGTNILMLFWFYLYYERNATKTAERLHMHRNTVIYHIEKIQKRFDFDLSWRVARERMSLEFKAFFLEDANNDFSTLFTEEGDGPPPMG